MDEVEYPLLDDLKLVKSMELDKGKLRQLLKEISRRRYVYLILKFLQEEGESYASEIAEKINVDVAIVWDYLIRLSEVGVVLRSKKLFDHKKVYYTLNTEFPINEFYKYYYRFVSYKLYKLVPYEGVFVEDLKEDEEFKKLCSKYFLSPEEGIKALCMNRRKIEVRKIPNNILNIRSGTVLIRKEQ